MLDIIFQMFFGIAFIMFFTGITNAIKLERETRTLLMIITTILFFMLVTTSFVYEIPYCFFDLNFQCTVRTHQMPEVAMIMLLFGVLSMIYVIMDFLGKIPHSKGSK